MRTITSIQYLQLTALFYLASRFLSRLEDVVAEAEELVGEKDGLTRDLIWSGEPPERAAQFIIEQLKIKKV